MLEQDVILIASKDFRVLTLPLIICIARRPVESGGGLLIGHDSYTG